MDAKHRTINEFEIQKNPKAPGDEEPNKRLEKVSIFVALLPLASLSVNHKNRFQFEGRRTASKPEARKRGKKYTEVNRAK